MKKLIDSFAYCFDVKITFFSLDFKDLLPSEKANSIFCEFLQSDGAQHARCVEQDKILCKRCRVSKRPILYECYAGLTEAVVPVIVDKKIRAYAVLGQFRMKEKMSGALRTLCRKETYEELELLFEKRPYYNPEKAEKILYLFARLVDFLVGLDEVKVEKPFLLDRLDVYLKDHLDEAIHIKEVCKFIGKNENTISYLLKKERGCSFLQYSTEYKISQFEKILAENPSLTIKEASSLVGYQDALYFSRVYKKYRGITPRSYVKQLREKGYETL